MIRAFDLSGRQVVLFMRALEGQKQDESLQEIARRAVARRRKSWTVRIKEIISRCRRSR